MRGGPEHLASYGCAIFAPLPVSPQPAVRLHRLEVAYGLAIGRDRAVRALSPPYRRDPREALEQTLLRALRRPPCFLSFSGGLDSSSLLATATAVARRHGLPDPIPATLVFASSAASDETYWQELVLDHLGLDREEWRRFEISDELGLVGPVAREVLRRHGLVWPFNLHFHLPIMKAAAGGSVITGFGGDELGRSSAGLHAERLLAKRRISRPRHAALVAYRLGPSGLTWVRELARGNAHAAELPWLTPLARRRLRIATAGENTHPFGWGRLLRRWLWRARYFQVCRQNFQLMADPFDVQVLHPFVEPLLLQTLGAGGRYAGLGGRPDILEHLMGGQLPAELFSRTTKASFDNPLWTAETREFAASWSGRGLDSRLVDAELARQAWLSPQPTAMSATMLQAAWLVDHG